MIFLGVHQAAVSSFENRLFLGSAKELLDGLLCGFHSVFPLPWV